MKIIKLEDRIIYRADKGKHVKFKSDDKLYSEIVTTPDDTREIEEV